MERRKLFCLAANDLAHLLLLLRDLESARIMKDTFCGIPWRQVSRIPVPRPHVWLPFARDPELDPEAESQIATAMPVLCYLLPITVLS